MPIPAYTTSAKCTAVEVTVAGSAVPGNPVERLRDFNWNVNRRKVEGRSDNAHYTTVLDVVHDGYSWTFSHADMVHAGEWVQAGYLHSMTIEVRACDGTTEELKFEGVLIEPAGMQQSWGELSSSDLRGTATQLWIDGVRFEGDLTINRPSNAYNYNSAGDTANHWEPYGLGPMT